MTVNWANTAKHVFERDFDIIQTISKYRISLVYDPMERVIIEILEKKGVSINNSSLFLGLAIWEYNTFVNYQLYWRVSIWSEYLDVFWNEYRGLLKKCINSFCLENGMSWEVFQAVESIYHWKSTRDLAANYSAPFSVRFKVKKTDNEEYKEQITSTIKEQEIRNKTIKDTKCEKEEMDEIVFDNYWDACVPYESNLYSIGRFIKKVIDIDNSLVNNEFVDEIGQAALCPNYVQIIENNLRRNLVEVFFYSIQDNKKVAKLLFEALEEFIPNTFNHRVELIIAPLVAILACNLKNKGCLYPMQFVKHEFTPTLGSVMDDVMQDGSTIISYNGDFSSLIEQWGKWKGIETPSEDECNLIFALVCGLQNGKESLFEYYYKKLSNQNCKSFLEAVIKLKNICSSLDKDIINTYLDDRGIDYGYEGYRNEEGLLYVSGPARDISTMIRDLDIPANSSTKQMDIVENTPTQTTTQTTDVHTNTPNDDNLNVRKRAETWPLPLDFFETDYIDNTSNEGDYIPGFLSGIVDFSLIGTDVTGKAMINGVWLSKYFSNFIEELATKGCFKNDVETKLAFAHALTGRRIKQGIKWKGSTFRRWANVICYITWKLYGGKYKYISKAFPELSETKLGKSYAKNLKNYTEIKDAIDVFLNKVVFLYSNKQEIDTQETEQPSSPE